MTFDTKLGVNIDPVGFYQRLWHLWNPLEWFGGLQDQYIGYAFPMGLFYLIAHLLHVPVWVAERLWMSLLITVAFWGLVRLAEALGIGSRPTRLLAGAAFALWPTFTILIGSTSGAVLPGVLAPWAVLPLVRYRISPGGGHPLGPRRGVHGRHQRGLHPGRAGAARNVHPDPAGAAPVGAGRLVGGGGAAGHGLVAGAAAVPGPVRLQLPALHRAGGQHHPDHVGGGGAARQRQLGRVPELRAAVADRRIGDGGIGVGGGGRRAGRRRRAGRAGPPRPARGGLAARHRRRGRPVGAGRLRRAAGRPAAPAGPDAAGRAAVGAAQRLQDRAGAGRGAGAGDRARPGPRRRGRCPPPRRVACVGRGGGPGRPGPALS